MTMYRFAEFDTRPTPEARAHNDSIFASGPVLGIEVTDAALAARCSLGNIDPQHGFHAFRVPTYGDKLRSTIAAARRRIPSTATDAGVLREIAREVLNRSLPPGPAGETIQQAYRVIFPSGGASGAEESAVSRCAEILDGGSPTLTGVDVDEQPPPGRCAIEFALRVIVGSAPVEATLATLRADLDSVGAMAIIALNAACSRRGSVPVTLAGIIRQAFHGGEPVAAWGFSAFYDLDQPIGQRVQSVIDADCFSPGGEWQPAPLPTRDRVWGVERGSVDSRRSLAAINKAVQDRDVPLSQRVEWMATWLLTGEEPAGYRERVSSERLALLDAITPTAVLSDVRASACHQGDIVEDDRITQILVARERVGSPAPLQIACRRCGDIGGPVSPDPTFCATCGATDRPIAVVQVEHMGATGIGYCIAPIVVARRPSTGKVTIAWWREGMVQRDELLAALNAEETAAGGAAKWGGGATIIGSPQGEGTRLELGRICHLVARHRLAHAA